MDEAKTGSRYSRRDFRKRAGVGAGALAGSGGGLLAPRAQAARSATVATSPTTFGWLFPDLPAFAPATESVRDALRALGAPGGPLDGKDDLSRGPKLLITDLSLSANNPNNPSHTAGTTFVGQFDRPSTSGKLATRRSLRCDSPRVTTQRPRRVARVAFASPPAANSAARQWYADSCLRSVVFRLLAAAANKEATSSTACCSCSANSGSNLGGCKTTSCPLAGRSGITFPPRRRLPSGTRSSVSHRLSLDGVVGDAEPLCRFGQRGAVELRRED